MKRLALDRPGALVSRRALMALVALFCLLKLAAVAAFVPEDPVAQLGFGFGGYVETLRSHGVYAECPDPTCSRAARSPLGPVVLAALSLLSERQDVVAVLKAVLMSALFAAAALRLLSIAGTLRPALLRALVLTLGAMCLSPPVVKHAAVIVYEEGFLQELLVLWAVAAILALRALLDPARDPGPATAANAWLLVLGAALVLLKSTMTPLFALSLVAAGAAAVRGRLRPGTAPLPAGATVLALLAVAVWSVHASRVVERPTLGTSYAGSNLFRAFNDATPVIYPHLTLDLVLSVGDLIAPDGTPLPRPEPPELGPDWRESDWNARYRQAALDWIVADPGRAARLTLKKAANFLLSLRRTPYAGTAHELLAPPSLRDRLEAGVTSAWLVAGRVAQGWLAVLLLRDLLARERPRRLAAAAALAALAAYAAPYVLVFNYERHITPFLVLCILLLALRRALPRAMCPANGRGAD